MSNHKRFIRKQNLLSNETISTGKFLLAIAFPCEATLLNRIWKPMKDRVFILFSKLTHRLTKDNETYRAQLCAPQFNINIYANYQRHISVTASHILLVKCNSIEAEVVCINKILNWSNLSPCLFTYKYSCWPTHCSGKSRSGMLFVASNGWKDSSLISRSRENIYLDLLKTFLSYRQCFLNVYLIYLCTLPCISTFNWRMLCTFLRERAFLYINCPTGSNIICL